MKFPFSIILYIYLFNQNNLNAQCTYSQIGSDIDGVANLDFCGNTVALNQDGNTVAIGSFGNDGGGTDRGHVRVFKNISGTWTQQGSDIVGEGNNDNSSFSLAISDDGSIVAIGALYNNAGGSSRGHVRVFQLISGTWTQLGSDIDGTINGGLFGYSISLSNDGLTLAIGVASDGSGIQTGIVKVFKYISGTWSQQGSNINGESNYDQSGRSVALNGAGNIVAIGSHFNAGNGSNSGHTRIYQLISGTWTQLGSDIDGEAANDQSSYSVSINDSGDIVAIGAPYNDGNGSNSGHTRVYKYISGTWTQLGADIDGEAANDESGTSVSLSKSGLILAIGAPNNSGGGSERGHVRIYKNVGTSWVQITSDIDGEANSDRSGTAVSLNSDGSTISIGAPFNHAGGFLKGHTRIYKLDCNFCDFNAPLPVNPGTYIAAYSKKTGTYVCYCDSNFNLLMAVDTTGTGAMINKDSVSLKIGTNQTLFWNIAGGLITNPNGGVIFNRKWNINPLVQPTNPVKVKYYFTQQEYDSLATKAATLGTTISSPTQLEMYKLNAHGHSDPHSSGITGDILTNGSVPSINNWVYSAYNANHCAEFLVSTFSGGGGGTGAQGIPLPLFDIDFEVTETINKYVLLNWNSNSKENIKHFEILRSEDGIHFETIGIQDISIVKYSYQLIDENVKSRTLYYYQLKIIDVYNTIKFSNIISIFVAENNLNFYPNPSHSVVYFNNAIPNKVLNISIYSLEGKEIYSLTTTNGKIDITDIQNGIYVLKVNGIYINNKLIISK